MYMRIFTTDGMNTIKWSIHISIEIKGHQGSGPFFRISVMCSNLLQVQPCPPLCCGLWTYMGGSTACPRWASSGSCAVMPTWSLREWRRPSSAAGASVVTTASTWTSTPQTCPFVIRRRATRTRSVSVSIVSTGFIQKKILTRINNTFWTLSPLC